MKETSSLSKLIFSATIAGNVLFILWIMYNGIKEGFPGTIVEKASYVLLVGLLSVNTFFLLKKKA